MADMYSSTDVEEIVRRLKEDSALEPASEQHRAAVGQGEQTQRRDRGPIGNFAEDVGDFAAGIIGQVRGRGQANSLEEFHRAVGTTIAQISSMPDGPERTFKMQNTLKGISAIEEANKKYGNIVKFIGDPSVPEAKQVRGILKKLGRGKEPSAEDWTVIGRVIGKTEEETSILARALKDNPSVQKAFGKALMNQHKTILANQRYGPAIGGLAQAPLPKEVTESMAVGTPAGEAISGVLENKELDTESKRLANATVYKNLTKKEKDGPEKLVGEGNVLRISTNKTILQAANNLSSRFDESKIGPITGPWENLKGKTGWTDQPQEEAKALSAFLENKLLNMLSGAAINEQEYKRLARQVPQPEDPPQKYKAKLEMFIENTTNDLNNLIETEGEAGRNISGFTKPKAAALGAKPPADKPQEEMSDDEMFENWMK